MKYAIVFTLFGLTCAFYALTSHFWPLKIVAACFAIAFCGVGLAYAFIGPRAFLKKPNGQLSWFSYVLYWPYHGLNAWGLNAARWGNKENAFDQIDDNVLDTYAPSLESLRTGAQWIQAEAALGPVYVHCAMGHGRSATFIAAYLLLSGQAGTPQEAVEQIQRLRPRIGLHPGQMARLEELAQQKGTGS